jgi:hypothetical protein
LLGRGIRGMTDDAIDSRCPSMVLMFHWVIEQLAILAQCSVEYPATLCITRLLFTIAIHSFESFLAVACCCSQIVISQLYI